MLVSIFMFQDYVRVHSDRLGLISVLSCFTTITGLSHRFQSPQWRLIRIGTFVAIGLSAFPPILHAVHLFPYEQLDKQAGLTYSYTEGSVILIGVGFYAVSQEVFVMTKILMN